jgi:hypothetical protein
MPTKLEKTVKREIEIDGQPYTVAISPEGLKITQKGFRKGQEVSWKDLWTSGNADSGDSSGGAPGTGGGGGAGMTGGQGMGGYGGGSESGYR